MAGAGRSWRWLFVLPTVWTALVLYWWIGIFRPWYCPRDAITCWEPFSLIVILIVSLVLVVLPFLFVRAILRRLEPD